MLAGAAVAWRIWRAGFAALPRRLWAVLALGLTFWSLTALNASFLGQATAGRYQYMGVIYVVMIAAELLRGVTVRRWVVWVALGVAALAAFANFSYLRNNANGLAGIAEQEKGGLAALELTRGVVADDFELTEDNSGVDYLGIVDAASYFSAIDAYGSPAYTPAELAGSSERSRLSADKVFASALGVGLVPADEAAAGRCVTARPGTETGIVGLPPGGALLIARSGSPRIALRRYATDGVPARARRACPRPCPGAGDPRRPLAATVAALGRRAREPLGLRARGRDVSAGGAASAAAPAPASRIAAWAADPRLPTVLLGAAAVVSAVLLVVLNSKLTFFIDDWEVLLHRRGLSLDVFMEPHAGHPAIGLAALYKAILVTFGMSSLTPYAVASTLVFVLSVVLLYVWMRRRVGAWLALAGALPILFLGAAYEDLLTPFQVGYFAPVACGLAALLALERGRPRDPLLCCALLVVGLSFQTIGLAFVAGVAVALAFDGELRRRAWVPIVPVVLYGLWYLGWGHTRRDPVHVREPGDRARVRARRVLGLARLAAGLRDARGRRAGVGEGAVRGPRRARRQRGCSPSAGCRRASGWRLRSGSSSGS